MDVESVSAELYGLPLDEFTATRTDREKQAKSAGDKDLAAQIRRLAKPNLVAWLANQLARQHADEIQELLTLGGALREATQRRSGEQLRELSRQQHQLVDALVQQARRLADAAGRKVSQDTARALDDTLRAALADPESGAALVTGRLSEGLQNTGFGFFTTGDPPPASVAAPRPAAPTPTPRKTQRTSEQGTPEQRTLEQRKRTEHDVEQAKVAADEALSVRREAYAQLEAADQSAADTRDRVSRLRRELDEALQEQSKAQKNQRRAQTAFDRAERRARQAQETLRLLTNK
jgi:hypothetical protein